MNTVIISFSLMPLKRESHDGFQHTNFTLFALLSVKESLRIIVRSMDHWLIMDNSYDVMIKYVVSCKIQ
jgi:hypothetical protein